MIFKMESNKRNEVHFIKMDIIMNKEQKIIELYEEYVGILGEELKDIQTIAMKNGFSSKRLKQISIIRNKIAGLKNQK